MLIKANSDLAIFGGQKVINRPFKIHNPIGIKERIATDRVMRSGVLSKYLGTWHPDFFGGEEVKDFEKFVGVSADGTWTLEITDHAASDQGTLKGVSLSLLGLKN